MSDITIYEPPVTDRGHMLYDPAVFEHGMRVATFLAQSQLVPQHFRGKPADVLLAMNLARRMGEDPLTILQVVHFVSGKPGWHAPFVISRINGSGLFVGPLEFIVTGKGPSLEVTCKGTLKNGGARATSVSMEMAQAEGWTKNPKYKSMPEVMLRYRAATFFCRLYCPEVLYGMAVTDELDDVEAAGKPTPQAAQTRGVAAIDAILDPPLTLPPDPEAQPTSTYERPAPEPPRSTGKATPETDARLLLNTLAGRNPGAPLPVTVEFAKVQFRGATGLSRIETPRWDKLVAYGMMMNWWRVDGDTLAGPVVQAAAEPVEPQPQTEAREPGWMDTLLSAIGELEAQLSDEVVCECATAAGLPVQNHEPVTDGAPTPMLEAYLEQLRARVRDEVPRG